MPSSPATILVPLLPLKSLETRTSSRSPAYTNNSGYFFNNSGYFTKNQWISASTIQTILVTLIMENVP